ncbi:MAG: hypothetical protein Q9M28_02255 [Mariprofundaceae bacterium]|nr:hypothetical protein [Mariprofundaceae bacterium]
MKKNPSTKLLLTEGKNDQHVILAIWNAHVGGHLFDIKDCGSDQKLLNDLEAYFLASTPPEVIGIVIDADDDHQARWQSLRDRLKNVGVQTLSEKADKGGTIILSTPSTPRIGVWIMPDNISDGMLEHFCSRITPKEGIAFADSCVREAVKGNHASFKSNHHQKAVIHTYLSWQNEPGLPLGLSIKTRNLKSEHPLVQSFVSWLEKLFNTPNQSTE